MSYRTILDKDEKNAKECLNCGRNFYVGEECPFCVITLPYCTKCHKIEIDGKKVLPLRAIVIVKDKMETIEKGSSQKIRIKFSSTTCEDCKAEDLCKTGPVAICTER